MININGKTPRLIKINGAVPDIVKINNYIIWKDAFSIDFKANFYWGSTSHSSGCSDWEEDDIRLSGFEITARHYFPHLYLDSIKITTDDGYADTFKYQGLELESGKTRNIEKFYWCGEPSLSVKVDFYFCTDTCAFKKEVSAFFHTDDLPDKDDFVLSAAYSGKISAFTEWEIELANAK